MEVRLVEIPRSSLDSMPTSERVFLIQLGTVLNEVNILRKCRIFAGNGLGTSDGLIKSADVTQSLFFLGTLAGKLHEAWRMLSKDYFGACLSREYDPLLPEPARASLKKFNKYFGRSNHLTTIRNAFVFHYGSEGLAEQIDKIPSGQQFQVVIAEHLGNCLYTFSNVIVTWSILNSIAANDPQRAMNTLVDEVQKVTQWFQTFAAECISMLVMKWATPKYTEVELPELPIVDNVGLPYFVKRSSD